LAREPYLAWKLEPVRQALARAGLAAEVSLAYAAGLGERRRVALHARRADGGVRLGFKARRTWRVVGIDSCVIARPEIVAALPALRALAEPFLASPRSAPTLHVTLTDSGLDIEVTGVERPGPSADRLARAAAIAREADFARVTLAGEMVYGARPALLRMGSATVALPPGAFLQATSAAEAVMADLVSDWAQGAGRLADLYCGVGTFTFRLARTAPVLALDGSAEAIASLKRAAGSAPGLKAISADVRDLDRRPLLAAEMKRLDLVVFDPPRAGAAAQAAELAKSSVARVAAVSCNLGTFVRDAQLLAGGGYGLDRVHLVDQFLFSPHIELVALFCRR
jgi:23S rRNA (uracil1939-C5)-methyltransferase